MEEEKRRILTKESVRGQLLRSMKAELSVVIAVVLFIETVMIALTYGAYRLSPRAWMLWGAFVLLNVAMIILFFAKAIWPVVKGRRYIVSGDFCIVEDKLVGVGEDEVLRSNGRRSHYTVDMLYFEGYGSIPADKGERGYGPCGSMFYMVVLNDPGQTLYTFYSSQLYCYKPESK